MNKLFDFSNRLSPQENIISTSVEHNECDVKEQNEMLLDYIYGLDPVTSLPCGDLAVYLGEKANPEVRNFIELNLLKERVDSTGALSLPNDVLNKMRSVINDDDIAAFARHHGESKEEYADRIKLYFLQEKKNRRDESYRKKVESLLKDM